MIHLGDIPTLQTHISTWKRQGQRIALVPTMGNLHQGHLALVKRAQELADITVVSLFVNPTQFDRQADLEAYPRTLEQDIEKLEAQGCDLLFAPDTDTMYGNKTTPTHVEAAGISQRLEGQSRPGHFSGVATIVSKLFNLTCPDIAIFGEKDYQQLMVIRALVEDLNYTIDIIGHPTVREADGLAMSSRNHYLTPAQRATAPALYQTLQHIKQHILAGERDYPSLAKQGKVQLAQHGFQPDYIEICRQQDLHTATAADHALVILASAWLGKARLIDNLAFVLEDH